MPKGGAEMIRWLLRKGWLQLLRNAVKHQGPWMHFAATLQRLQQYTHSKQECTEVAELVHEYAQLQAHGAEEAMNTMLLLAGHTEGLLRYTIVEKAIDAFGIQNEDTYEYVLTLLVPNKLHTYQVNFIALLEADWYAYFSKLDIERMSSSFMNHTAFMNWRAFSKLEDAFVAVFKEKYSSLDIRWLFETLPSRTITKLLKVAIEKEPNLPQTFPVLHTTITGDHSKFPKFQLSPVDRSSCLRCLYARAKYTFPWNSLSDEEINSLIPFALPFRDSQLEGKGRMAFTELVISRVVSSIRTEYDFAFLSAVVEKAETFPEPYARNLFLFSAFSQCSHLDIKNADNVSDLAKLVKTLDDYGKEALDELIKAAVRSELPHDAVTARIAFLSKQHS